MPLSSFLQRQKELLLRFRTGIVQQSDSSPTRMERYDFFSSFPEQDKHIDNHYLQQDSEIEENLRFTYDIIIPSGRNDFSTGIVLLHGLNERSWSKYLQWADYLAAHTGKPVILFPIAFHMNRSPSSWANPRLMKFWMEIRKKTIGTTSALSFANVALSNRLSDEPYRFYYAGRQTVNDLASLAKQILLGHHPLFQQGATLDFLGYSIGSFLAEILLMANPDDLFLSSRLFVFCGGSIFRHMYGTSRYIMDEKAYEHLLAYYCNDWFKPFKNDFDKNKGPDDGLQQAFNAMISPDFFRKEREAFFKSRRNRIAGISLKKDQVMPYRGVEACMGKQNARECFELIDFPFEYTHENPFPLNERIDEQILENSFHRVFWRCASFLA